MPLHDWTRVSAGTFHGFHTLWIGELTRSLNTELLPSQYYAEPEQVAGQTGPDVLTLELKRAQLTGSWFLLMHPGTGLHAPDIKVLGGLMKTMCERGASFVLLENRQEFQEFADRVLTF